MHCFQLRVQGALGIHFSNSQDPPSTLNWVYMDPNSRHRLIEGRRRSRSGD